MPTKTPAPQAPGLLVLPHHSCNVALNYSTVRIRHELEGRFTATHTAVDLSEEYECIQSGLNTVFRHLRRGDVSAAELEMAAQMVARESMALLTAVRAHHLAHAGVQPGR